MAEETGQSAATGRAEPALNDTAGYALSPGEGHAFATLGGLLTIKAAGAHTRDGFAVFERTLPVGFTELSHTHSLEDEALYVLGGDLQVTCAGRSWDLAAGAFVFLPRGEPHGFAVLGADPVKTLTITSPAGFEQFAAEVGLPTTDLVIRTAEPHDAALRSIVAVKYGIKLENLPSQERSSQVSPEAGPPSS